MDRSPPARGAPPGIPRLSDAAEPADTRAKILEAAFRRLATEGYAALSVREIAKDAGVNHALINYHFRSKDQLVIAVLDAANRRLLARQSAMYDSPTTPVADKWAQARRFYEDDLASGFVRVQAELMAASFSNPELREKVVPRVTAWKQLVLQGVREALAQFSARGVVLPPPFSAEVIACWISEFWLGMEFADLLGVQEQHAVHRAALDAVHTLLRALDTGAQAARTKARGKTATAESKPTTARGKTAAARPRNRSR